MRHFAAIFFLLVFSFQVLPFKTIGKFLGKSQQTEEVKDGCCDSDDDKPDSSKEQKYNDLFHHHDNATSAGDIALKKKLSVIHGSDDLPNSYVEDIICPPPNC